VGAVSWGTEGWEHTLNAGLDDGRIGGCDMMGHGLLDSRGVRWLG
jgi:hypothetical protein